MKRTLFAILTVFALIAPAGAQTAEPVVRGLLFYADWCAKCKVLEPTLLDAVAPYEASGDFELVRLDLTDQRPEAIAGQRLKARALDAQKAFDDHAPSTGLMILIDAATGREIAKITSKATYAGIQAAVDEALSKARET